MVRTLLPALAALALVFPPMASASEHRVHLASSTTAPIANVRLEPPSVEELPAASAALVEAGALRQVGVGRTVMALRSGDDVFRRLAWQSLPDGGRVAALSITSPGAAALRVGLRIHLLPRGTVLRFYAPASDTVVEVTNEEVRTTLWRNMEDDDELVQDTRTFWSPVVGGDTLVLEVQIPGDASLDDVRLTAPAVSHLGAAAMPEAPSASSQERFLFTRAGSSFLCATARIASECVSTQTEASTIQRF